MKKLRIEERRKLIKNYIKLHPRATSREIKKDLHVRVERAYKGGISEAFKEAGVIPPRTFKRMTKEEKKKILIDYIRKNPVAGGHKIVRDTKINYLSVFNNIKELFLTAGLKYPREELRNLYLRDKGHRKQEIIRLIRQNPLIGIDELIKVSKMQPYHFFRSITEMYLLAGVEYQGKGALSKINKQTEVINFIKENNFATQREINFSCKTKVQELFDGGIFEAYERAGVLFPYERLKLHGSAIKTIRDEASVFEQEIAKRLSGYGTINRLVKTKRGVADIILERKGKKIGIELKNYKAHEISISQINQLNKYLEDINSNIGFLVCLKKPKKDTFLIGENRIFIILESELSKIPEIADL